MYNAGYFNHCHTLLIYNFKFQVENLQKMIEIWQSHESKYYFTYSDYIMKHQIPETFKIFLYYMAMNTHVTLIELLNIFKSCSLLISYNVVVCINMNVMVFWHYPDISTSPLNLNWLASWLTHVPCHVLQKHTTKSLNHYTPELKSDWTLCSTWV